MLRPFFRRGIIYVVVRPLRIGSALVLTPGTEIKPGDFKTFQLRNWYRRRRIGPKDHPWTQAMLQDQSTFARPELASRKKGQKKTPSASELTLGKNTKTGYPIMRGDEELERVKGKKAALMRLEELQKAGDGNDATVGQDAPATDAVVDDETGGAGAGGSGDAPGSTEEASEGQETEEAEEAEKA